MWNVINSTLKLLL